jgi:hypothetical protein
MGVVEKGGVSDEEFLAGKVEYLDVVVGGGGEEGSKGVRGEFGEEGRP